MNLQDHIARSQHHRQPRFAQVDEPTADLLSLVAEDPHPSVDHEWELFKAALKESADPAGYLSQNTVRPLITDKIAPRRVGPFYRRACAEGLIHALDEWEISDDVKGKNSGRPVRKYRWV